MIKTTVIISPIGIDNAISLFGIMKGLQFSGKHVDMFLVRKIKCLCCIDKSGNLPSFILININQGLVNL